MDLAPKPFTVDHYCHIFVKARYAGLQLSPKQTTDPVKYLLVTSLLTNVRDILLATLQCVTLTDLKSIKA